MANTEVSENNEKKRELLKLKVKKGKPMSDANLAILRRRNHSRAGTSSALGCSTSTSNAQTPSAVNPNY